MLILGISADDLRGNFVHNRPDKISVTQLLSGPKLFLRFRKLSTYYLDQYTLHDLYNSGGRIPGGRCCKKMNVILFYFHRIYLKLVPRSNLLEYLLKPLCQTTLQYQFLIFGKSNHIILEIIDNMSGSLDRAHAQCTSRLVAFGIFHKPLAQVRQVQFATFHEAA